MCIRDRGSGGEIRDRIAGGQAALPLAGTAVYMTSYPRLDASRIWEQDVYKRQEYKLPLRQDVRRKRELY